MVRQETTLMGVPPEFCEKIGEHVDQNDLRNMRLICKDADNKILRLFAMIFFSRVDVMLCDEGSLHRGIEIAAHPDFGPAVQTITIYVDELPTVEQASRTVDFVQVLGHDEFLHKARKDMGLLKRLKLAEDNFRGRNQDSELLVLIFTKLQKYGKVSTVEFKGNLNYEDGRESMAALAKYGTFAEPRKSAVAGGTRYDFFCNWHVKLQTPPKSDYRYFAVVVKALYKSGLGIKQMIFQSSTTSAPVDSVSLSHVILPFHLISCDIDLLKHLTSIISGLKMLRLAIWDDGLGSSDDKASQLAHIFCKAVKLETLQLDIASRTDRGPLSYAVEEFATEPNSSSVVQAVMQKTTIPTLRNIALAGATIAFSELCVFAKRHSTLQGVKIERCKLGGIEVFHKSLGEDRLEQKLSEVLGAEVEYSPTLWYKEQ